MSLRWSTWVLVAVGIACLGAAAHAGSAGRGPRLDGSSRRVGVTVGPDGAVWFANNRNGTIGRLDSDGTLDRFTADGMVRPWAIAAGPDRSLWFTDRRSNLIGRVTTGGDIR